MLGRFVNIEVDKDFMFSVTPSSVCEDDNALERALYCRDFDSVQESIGHILDNVSSIQRELLETASGKILFKPHENNDEFTVGCLQNDKRGHDGFKDDIKKFMYSLPDCPFNRQIIEKDVCLRATMEMVKIKLALKACQENHQMDKLIEFFEAMQLANMPASIMFELISTLSQGNYDKKMILEKAIKLLPILGPRLDADGCRIVHLLLYPTIFDEHFNMSEEDQIEQPPSAQPNREHKHATPVETVKNDCPIDTIRAVRNTKTAIQMLNLELDHLKNGKADSQSMTISFTYHWQLLRSFVEKGNIDDYFMHSFRLQKTFPTAISCHLKLNTHRDKQVVPKLNFFFEQAAADKRATMSLRCLLSVCRIVQAALQANVTLSVPLDNTLVFGVRSAMKGHRMTECIWFGGYTELKAAMARINLRDRHLKRIVSSPLLKELHLLHSKLL